MKTWIKVTLGIVVFFVILGIIFGSLETKYQEGNIEDLGEGCIKIIEHSKSYNDFGGLVIKGTAENVAGRQLKYAEIRVKFIDENDAVIDTFLDNINDLNAGEKWGFEVLYQGLDDNRVEDYQIAIGACY